MSGRSPAWQVEIPPQVPPDRKIIVATPTGQVMVDVPPGMAPGDMLNVQMPPQLVIAPIPAPQPIPLAVKPQDITANMGPAEVAMAAQLHRGIAEHPEEMALMEIAKLFDFLDFNDDGNLTR